MTTITPTDEEAIRAVVLRMHEAFASSDAQKFVAELADDADWENAFGRRAHGREQIQELLARVFPLFQGATTTTDEIRVVPIESNIAVAETIRTVRGQRSRSGSAMTERRVRTTIVLRREASDWIAALYRVADLRDPAESA